MITDVSSRPRACPVDSGTRSTALVEHAVDVGPEPLRVERSRGRQGCDRHRRRDEALSADRVQLANRHSIACHDERLPAIELSHDLAAFVPKLPLSDLPSHTDTVAQVRQVGPIRAEGSMPIQSSSSGQPTSDSRNRR